MSVVESALTVGAWVTLLTLAYWPASSSRLRAWTASGTGRRWARQAGVAAAAVGVAAVSAFGTAPELGVHLFALAGVLAYVVGALGTASAARTAIDAVGPEAGHARQLRAFWCAARVYHRETRSGFGAALVAFLAASLTAALSTDALVTATGAVSLGGVLACVGCIAAVGGFVPAARNESVAESVDRARQ